MTYREGLGQEQTEKKVEYRLVDGFPDYCVGTDGSVWSCKNHRKLGHIVWKRLRPGNRNGYSVVLLGDGLKKKPFAVHSLVLSAFVGPCPKGFEACHHPDENKRNNNLSNLRWGTHENNLQDIVRGGKLAGENHSRSILNNADVREIRRLYLDCGLTYEKIGGIFGISAGHACDIVNRKYWKHLT